MPQLKRKDLLLNRLAYLVFAFAAGMIFLAVSAFAVPEPDVIPRKTSNQPIQWMTFAEAMEQSRIEPRKIFVNLSTQWCPSCRKMDQTTFRNEAIVNYISEKYYAVKFDGGSNEEIVLNGETYGKEGRVHHLAMFLSRRSSVVFPTYAVMDEDFQNPQPVYGYQDPESLDKFLTFFGEDYHESTEWEIFDQTYVYQRK